MLFDRKLARAIVVAAFALNGLLLIGSSCSIVGDGVDQRELLTHTASFDEAPLWWPDGSRIAVAMPPEGMYVVDVQDSEISIFPPGAPVGACRREWPFAPALSPDGSRLAYVVAKKDGRSEIVTRALDGSNGRRLTKDRGVHVHPAWSPDGTQIAFMSGSIYRDRDLYVMDADGSNKRKIAPTNNVGDPPAWSPDGSRIAFAGRREDTRDRTVYTVRPDGSDLVEIGLADGGPAWSPDGSRLAYVGSISRNVLTVVDPDGTNRRELAFRVRSGWQTAMSWSPDGSKIVFGGAGGFYIVSADGTGTSVYVRGADRARDWVGGGASWSPDGSTIAYYANRTLFTTAHDGSDRRVLARGVSEAKWVAWGCYIDRGP